MKVLNSAFLASRRNVQIKRKKKKKGGDERRAGSLICDGEVGGKSEQRRDKEREKEVFAVRVWLNPQVPLRWVLGRAPSHLDSYEKHWKRRLKSSGEDKGREEDFSKSSGSHAVLQLPAEIRDGQKEFDLTQSHSLHESAHTLHWCRSAQRQEQIRTCHTDTHSLTL